MSASSQEETEKLKKKHGLNFDFYFCDMTTLKTIVRSNPGLVMLENGTITQKLHFNDAADLKLVSLPARPKIAEPVIEEVVIDSLQVQTEVIE